MGFRSLKAKAVASRPKINTLRAAKEVLVSKLQDNIDAWNDNEGANLPKKGGNGVTGLTQNSVWFKSNPDTEDGWLIQLRIGQKVVHLTVEDMNQRKSWYEVPDGNVAALLQEIMEEVKSGELDDILEAARTRTGETRKSASA